MRAPRTNGHDFLYRTRRDERIHGLLQVDYAGDWHAAEKALTGVEVRDPTADLDVISYCFGVPPEQYLAEGIDRSLIRRAMWGLRSGSRADQPAARTAGRGLARKT